MDLLFNSIFISIDEETEVPRDKITWLSLLSYFWNLQVIEILKMRVSLFPSVPRTF